MQSITYAEKRKDPRWQKKRLQILDIAQWRCEDCGRADKTLDVHHTAYVAGAEPWEYSSDLLMSVCHSCHEFRQRREDAIRVHIGRITRFMNPNQLEEEVWEIIREMTRRQNERLSETFS